MDALEQFLGGQATKPTGGTKIAPDVQASRDKDALGILQSELKKAQDRFTSATDNETKSRYQGDINSLNREIARASKTPIATPTAAPVAAQAVLPTAADPLEAFFSGQAPTQATPQAAQPSTTGTMGAEMGGYVPRPSTGEPRAQLGKPSVVGSLVGKYLQAKRDVGEKTVGAIQNLGERAAGAIDTLYEVLPATYGAVQQAIVRPFTTPQKAEELGKQAGQFIAPSQPLGKIFGITGKETYQQPLGGITQPIAEQVNKMFNVLGMTPEQISEKTGIPASDIRGMVTIGSVAVPQAIKELAPGVKQIGQAIAKPIKEAAAELQVVKPLSKAEAQAQFEARQAPEGSAGAAATANNPFAGQITGEETVRGQFPQIKLSKTPNDVPVSEQRLRSQIVQEIAPEGGVRPGVVTGNENTLRTEYTKAKLGTPEGDVYKQKIANEQAALSKFAEDRVNATGASTRLINDEQRGTTINDVFHGQSAMDDAPTSITGYLNQAKKQVYDSAFQKVGNNQINTSHIDDLLKDPQWAAGLKIKGVEGVQSAAQEYLKLAKTVGFKDANGVLHPPGSVAAYDSVRKAMNAEWTPQNARAIQKVNQAIDQDIASVADPALYKLGDKIHQVEKTILGSRGIKTLFGETDANGVVTSSTALEKIPTKLNNLPKDQWRHIRDTLSELENGRVRGAPEGMPPVPQELRQAAAAARAEIDGALAREVQSAGASKMGEWNQNSANKVMNSVVGQKILETFPPDEVRKFHVLNYAGHLMPGIHGYEGAALQARRVGMIEGNLGKLGTGAGAAIGGAIGEAPGAAVGAYIGGQAGVKASERMAAKALSKEALKAQKEMQKAAALGKQTGTNKLQDLGK